MQEASGLLSRKLMLAAIFGILLLILVTILINGLNSQPVLYTASSNNQANSYVHQWIASLFYGLISLAIWVLGVIFTKIINNITNDYWYPALLNFFNEKKV